MGEKEPYTKKRVLEMFKVLEKTLKTYQGWEMDKNGANTGWPSGIFLEMMPEVLEEYREKVPQGLRENFKAGKKIEEEVDAYEEERKPKGIVHKFDQNRIW